jgi:hypothetical protein
MNKKRGGHAGLVILLLMGAIGLGTTSVFAQTPVNPVGAAAQTAPAPTPFQITKREGNKRVWERTVYEAGPGGKVFAEKHSYTELGTGLCYKDANGNWADSKEVIEAYPQGAIARQGPYQVIFANNLNSTGAIDQQTPDGKRLRSNILGLGYYDRASGQSVVIAEVQDSQGELISANQVLYPNAFTGVKADVRYTYKKGSFEQDVILREQPPTPESVGLNSETTEIEVLTEFIDPPSARIQEHEFMGGSLPDDEVSFGIARLGRGKAFDLGETSHRPSQIKVRRQFTTVQGRHILIEGVPIKKIEADLTKLPLQSSIQSRQPLVASKTRMLPKTPAAQPQPKPIKLAANAPASRGFVLDYVEINADETNFTFQSDSTYYVTGEYVLLGTTTIEGGAVVKLNGSGQLDIDLDGTVVCQTGPYRPGVFTSINDNSLGEIISGSTGTPSCGDVDCFLYINSTNLALTELRFSYGTFGIYHDYPSVPAQLDIWDSQFLNDDFAVYAYNLGLHNALIGNAGCEGDPTFYTEGPSLDGENVTADGGNVFLYADYIGTPTIALTNCLITSQPFADYRYTPQYQTNTSVWLPSPTVPVYQTVGAGAYYLTNNSPYHNAGTTNISPSLLASLAAKTTYPPVAYGYESITVPTTLGQHALRDNAGNPDLGYHYDPLDYLFGACDLHTNLTFTAGVAVGWFEDTGGIYSYGQPYGISLNSGSSFTSTGTATAPNWIARYNTVQEGVLASRGWLGGLLVNGSGAAPIPQVTAQFTKISTEPNMGTFIRDNWAYGQAAFSDCELYAGFPSYRPSMFFTNCLFFRCGITFESYGQDSSFAFQNCTWWQGSFNPNRYGTGASQWTILNTTFDGTGIATYDARGGSTSYTTFNYNAFLSGSNLLETVGSHDLTNNTSFNWESSWLGNYYLPTNSPLINAGSTNANYLGLYHFTTQTNQVVEGDSVVDIGYHYVATDQYGNPLDSNGDGVPDYLEDANGDGLFDAGELADWQAPVFSTGQMNFTNGVSIYIFEPKPASNIP